MKNQCPIFTGDVILIKKEDLDSTMITETPKSNIPADVGSSVFVLQHKENRRILGCFDTREKAENYVSDSVNIEIIELQIA